MLGKNFFGGVKLRPEHTLVTEGPSRTIRHPIYSAFFLIGFGFLFLSGNWMVGVPWLAGSLIVVLTRLKTEEDMMLEEFGEAYRDYQLRSGRFLPRF